MRTVIKSTIFLIILALLAACAPTIAQVTEKYKEPFAQKRKQLIAIAESLPPVGSVLENGYCENMDPLLIVNDDFSEKGTTGSLLMYEQLLNPDVDLWESELFDVSLGGDFLALSSGPGRKIHQIPVPRINAAPSSQSCLKPRWPFLTWLSTVLQNTNPHRSLTKVPLFLDGSQLKAL